MAETRRRSIRLRGFDYSRGGAYFITVCTEERRCILDDSGIIDMIASEWRGLSSRFCRALPDVFVAMPNHFHGVVFLAPHTHQRLSEPRLGDIICAFKSITTVKYIEGIKQRGWEPIKRRLWQRNYYERIIRNEKELFRIREYISNNPRLWDMDRENPDCETEHEFYEWLYGQRVEDRAGSTTVGQKEAVQ